MNVLEWKNFWDLLTFEHQTNFYFETFTLNMLFLDPSLDTDGKGNLNSTMESTDPGLVAGIVIGVVSLGLLLLALVAVLCYRHYLHRNVTSMNFDNPVYRKTTEDQFSLEKNRFPLPAATVGEEVKMIVSN